MTLIELAVAVAAFAVLAVAAFAALQSMAANAERLTADDEAWQQARWTLTRLQRELEQAVERPASGGGFEGGVDGLRFASQVRRGLATDSELVAIEYRWDGQALVRTMAGETQPPTEMLTDVTAMDWAYFDPRQGWRPDWRPADGALPAAVRVRWRQDDVGELERTLLLPGSER